MDQIQRKLSLIDSQLAGNGDFYKKIISTCPLSFAAVGLIAGITIQNAANLSIWWPIGLLIVFAIAAAITYLVNKTDRSLTLGFLVLFCFVCLGAVRLIHYRQPMANDIRNFLGQQKQLATVRGQILTNPFTNKNDNWQFGKFKYTDPTTSFYMQISQVESTKGWKKTSGTIRVYVNEPILDLKAGDYVQIYCWLDRFKKTTNPGQFDMAEYLAKKNIFVAASVRSKDSVELLKDDSPGFFARSKYKFKKAAAETLARDVSTEDQSYGLIEALLLGYRGDIKNDIHIAFKKTGLLHFISLSGMHLGILMGIIWWLCKTAGLMKRSRATVCIIAIGAFLMIVPPRPPILRAAVICSVFCISFLFGRKSNPFNTLSLAAVILLLARPTNLFEAGWQLSFASVLGILLFCHRIHAFMYEKITGLPESEQKQKSKPFFHIISRPGPYILRLFSTGVSAWISGAGVLLYHFYTICPLTCVWTVIVFPLVVLILTVGFLKMTLSLILPTAGLILGNIVNLLADFLIAVVRFIEDLNISQILIGKVPVGLVIFYYAIIFFATFCYFKRPAVKKAALTVMILLLTVFIGNIKWKNTYPDDLILNTLDVGHGQAIVMQLPPGETIIFDAGSLSKNNIGKKTVSAFLDYKGIGKIDKLFISHNDIDHINGIPEIVEHCPIDNIYANNSFFQKDKWKTARFLQQWLNNKDIEISSIGNHLDNNSKAKIKIIWPDQNNSAIENLSDNDTSLVCLIEFADKKILLCSDIEKFAQREILRLHPNLKADIVVVPHHGSKRTIHDDFLKNLEADILICSGSRRQFENRSPLRTQNSDIFYTAKDGAIAVSIHKDGSIKTNTFIKE